jgi:hypothetical protein
MLNPEDDHAPSSQSAGRPLLSIDAMTFARTLAAEYQEMETGYRNVRYGFLAKALTSYRKFLKEPGSYEELCAEDNISPLREKPALSSAPRDWFYIFTPALGMRLSGIPPVSMHESWTICIRNA